VPTPGLRAIGLRAERVRPEAVFAAGERAPPGRLVPTVLCRVLMGAVHSLGHHGHKHWVPGGSHNGVHRRDQRTQRPGYTVHVLQFHDRHGTPAGVCARVDISLEDDNARKLPGAHSRRRGHFAGTSVKYFFFFTRSLIKKSYI